MTYPIAETFTSIQGEGAYTGTPMYFIRLAGCNVGKYTPIAMQQPLETDPRDLRVLRASNPDHSVCEAWDGHKFLCDTNYKKSFEANESALLNDATGVEHICITGGEPFLHDLSPLISLAQQMDQKVHVETSGTIQIPQLPTRGPSVWITCSPKTGWLESNYYFPHEWKFIVCGDTKGESIREFLHGRDKEGLGRPVYLQPEGNLGGHYEDSLENCMEILKGNPRWRLSAQLHKYLEMR